VAMSYEGGWRWQVRGGGQGKKHSKRLNPARRKKAAELAAKDAVPVPVSSKQVPPPVSSSEATPVPVSSKQAPPPVPMSSRATLGPRKRPRPADSLDTCIDTCFDIGLDEQPLLLVFDITAENTDERDSIVHSCHVKQFPEWPLPVTDRKEMYGHIFRNGGTCTLGSGKWSDINIAAMLEYVDSVSWMSDRTMKYGLYPGIEGWMEHVWPRCDVMRNTKLAELLQVNPLLKVASMQQPGLQPLFCLSL